MADTTVLHSRLPRTPNAAQAEPIQAPVEPVQALVEPKKAQGEPEAPRKTNMAPSESATTPKDTAHPDRTRHDHGLFDSVAKSRSWIPSAHSRQFCKSVFGENYLSCSHYF